MVGNLHFKIDWASCLWWEICISKLIGLALQLEGNLPVFALCYFAFEGNFQVQTPRGLIFGGTF